MALQADQSATTNDAPFLTNILETLHNSASIWVNKPDCFTPSSNDDKEFDFTPRF